MKPQTIDEYIAMQDEAVQPRLQEVRGIIHSAIPEAEERISWSMPTFWKGRNLIHFAASKKHSKGTIRIPWNRALPETLIREIARWCYEEYRK